MRFYGEISRIDEEQRMVWGYASTEQRATDGKIITRAAMEGALDAYMEFANVREMHQLSAVGRTDEASVDEGGLYIGVKVVDDGAWKKVVERVYRGFSIGAKATAYDELDRTVITGMVLREISLVDRPSDPGAKFDVIRVDGFDDDDDIPIQEDDMSRAARKTEAPASTTVDAPAAAAPAPAVPAEVLRTEPAESPAAPAAESAQAAEAPAEGGGASETAPDPAAAPEGAAGADVVDPVERAVQGAAEVQDLIRAKLGETTVFVPLELPGAEIRRGLSLVSRLGYMLTETAYIVNEAQWEKEIEGDNSPVPDMLRSALVGLADAYRSMSAEEVTELLASVGAGPVLDQSVIMFAAGGADLERSATTVSEAQAVQIQAAIDSYVARGFVLRLPEAEPTDLQRAVEGLTADRDKVVRTVEELSDNVRRLLDMPAAPKTGGALARAVDKEEDAGGPGGQAVVPQPSTEDVQRALDAMPEDERALVLIRAARALPIPISNRPSS